MRDRIPAAGKAGRMLITPENGTAPFYATVTMADDPLEEGTPLVKSTLLSDNTEVAVWGDSADRTVDAALKMLSDVAYGRLAIIDLTVLDTDGAPVPDVTVKLDASPVVGTDERTDENGYLRLYTDGGSHTVHLVYPMGYTGETSNHTVEVSGTRVLQVKEFGKSSTANFILTSAKTFYIARHLSPVEFDLRGGGGSGGVATSSPQKDDVGTSTYLRAQGGAAGYANRPGAIDVAGKLIRVSVGAGGAARYTGGKPGSYRGNTGGTTSVSIDGATYSAAGGRGGQTGITAQNTSGGSVGGAGEMTNYTGNTNAGGAGLPLFGDDSQSQYGGGGGGGYARGSSNCYSGNAGLPHGTRGSGLDSMGSDGRSTQDATYSGGSGGFAGFGQSTSWGDKFHSGKGGDGFVAFRKAV